MRKLRHKEIKVIQLIKVTEPEFTPGPLVPEFTNVFEVFDTEKKNILGVYLKLVFRYNTVFIHV